MHRAMTRIVRDSPAVKLVTTGVVSHCQLHDPQHSESAVHASEFLWNMVRTRIALRCKVVVFADVDLYPLLPME